MTEILTAFLIFALLIIGVAVALHQHERDMKRGTLTDPEKSPLWWGGIILVMVLSAYGAVAENDARVEAVAHEARR
jgi:heme A synthase